MEIIPAIDIIDGKCVRLTQGDYARKKEYASDPVEVARKFEDAGIRRLHLVDLDGAKAKRIVNKEVLEGICKSTSLQVDFGGGIQSNEDLELAFRLGAKQVTGGSIAVKNPALFTEWLQTHGGERLILGADAKNRKIAISGWQETTAMDLIGFIREYAEKGVKYVICTDVAKDGLLQGPSLELYQEIMKEIPEIDLIASGGVASVKDLEDLEEAGVYGVIVGKAFYEGKISLSELRTFIRN
ncbi:1-(5-phosphoribosyl)-5-[(5-phosphoribosylamino)methylideneamino]imidazole-4-carboxamide isomerase [Cyclobacterium jeungdonense]|uniref:1-(5-phosphoribosyl)-5-[(5-phosphoribosylamino)methylideneamino] imidazole-4-carboxamide isomerase n=1 Tax=Cyclobacterium jeungdonense TaxID=708087 RepID=A0ABT8C703_9BACT|nr:1-(5-phosphoribosyl)-5-[(5-phosphoribosylamino)methylideneamino]imidazole-4-carboxamide isomerase [Cyclobacterium jeungdonense]MDN3688146.1 1-(5-phosphoribosyl)-5-[(5-phosphoribosylamino)methylideneamino]imidazole-4-carboxamide isomerase [Cyclobacterium jeungdonense]